MIASGRCTHDEGYHAFSSHFVFAGHHVCYSTRPFLNLIEKKWIAFQMLSGIAEAHSHNVNCSHGFPYEKPYLFLFYRSTMEILRLKTSWLPAGIGSTSPTLVHSSPCISPRFVKHRKKCIVDLIFLTFLLLVC